VYERVRKESTGGFGRWWRERLWRLAYWFWTCGGCYWGAVTWICFVLLFFGGGDGGHIAVFGVWYRWYEYEFTGNSKYPCLYLKKLLDSGILSKWIPLVLAIQKWISSRLFPAKSFETRRNLGASNFFLATKIQSDIWEINDCFAIFSPCEGKSTFQSSRTLLSRFSSLPDTNHSQKCRRRAS